MFARLRVPCAGLVSLLAVVACSSSDPPSSNGKAGCTFFQDPNNCWRSFVAAVSACDTTDAAVFRGHLSADRTSCTYDDGRSITFSAPVDLGTPGGVGAGGTAGTSAVVTFTLHAAGGDCLKYASSDGYAFTATGPSGTFTMGSRADGTFTCPDGSKHVIDGAGIDGSCPEVKSQLPAANVEADGADYSFDLTDAPRILFTCSP